MRDDLAMPKALLGAMAPRHVAEFFIYILGTRRRLIGFGVNGTMYMVARQRAKELVEDELRRVFRGLASSGKSAFDWLVVLSANGRRSRLASPKEAALYLLQGEEVLRA